MDDEVSLDLGYERVHRLELLVGLVGRGFVDLRFAAYLGDQRVVAEDPVVDERRAFGYVLPVGPQALERADGPFPSDLGVAIALAAYLTV